MYVDYGYYIIRPCRCPEFLKDFSQWILTASSCICDVEPQRFSCMTNDERQREEYRKRLGLEKREFIDFSEETLRLFGEDRLDTDSRFVFKQDADEIYRRYFSKQKGVDRGYRLIGIALEEAHLPSMEDRIIPKNVASRTAERHFLGFDILGWDISGFHTYLCNSLQKELVKRFKLKPGEFGLLKNSKEEVEAFADAIQNRGEPVEWIPFAVYDDTPAAAEGSEIHGKI